MVKDDKVKGKSLCIDYDYLAQLESPDIACTASLFSVYNVTDKIWKKYLLSLADLSAAP